MRELYIIGAGGHGAVVAELAAALEYRIGGFIDADPRLKDSTVLNWRVLGGLGRIPKRSMVAFGIGDNQARSALLREAVAQYWHLPVLIHPSAVVSPSAELGAGTVVMPQAVVNARSRTGLACILNTACSVDHDCILGNAVHIGPGAHLAGGVTVGDETLIGIGSEVRQGISIGSECILGAGSVVVSDFPDHVTAYGNPAHLRKES